jgi:hypothetical protein
MTRPCHSCGGYGGTSGPCSVCGATFRVADWSVPQGLADGNTRRLGQALLTFGQLISVLGCLTAILWPVTALLLFPDTPRVDPIFTVVGLVGAFLYSAAMLVVFSRIKRLPPG